MKIISRSFLLVIVAASIASGQSKVLQSYKKNYEAFERQGDFASAVAWAEKAVALAEKEFGKEHESYAAQLNDLASLNISLGHLGEAESMLQQALTIRKKMLDKEHPDVAESLSSLAELYAVEGRYGEAEPLLQQALAIQKKSLGEGNPSVAKSLSLLAGLYFMEGRRFGEIEPLLRRALAIQEKVLGKEHRDTAESLYALAELYRRQSRHAEAEPLLQRALAIQEKVLGKEHPDVATCLKSLAELYHDQGRYGDAESLYSRLIAIQEKVLGKEHPDVANSLNNLATIYVSQGRYREAESIYRRAIEIQQKTLNKEHPDVAISLNNLATLYYDLRFYEEAKTLYQIALKIKERALGKEHLSVATTLENLAALYSSEGRNEDAVSLSRRVIAVREKTLGKEHPDVANSLNNLAFYYSNQRRHKKAEPLLRRALAIWQKTLGAEHPKLSEGLNNMGVFYYEQGRYKEAEPFFEKAIANFLHQINTHFSTMSEAERDQFYQTINYGFEVFNSFALKRIKENPAIAAKTYNNQIAIKALLLNSTTKVKRQILNSNDNELISLYRKWINQKEYLAKVYTLSKAEIAQQGINKDSLEAAANDLEKQLSRRSEVFAQVTDTTSFTWRDIQKTLQPHEATIEMVRFRWFRKSWTDTVYYAALIVTPQTKNYPELVLLKNGNDLEGKFYHEYAKCRQTKNGVAYQHYWQPIKEKLQGITKVYFSPDGIYNQMNLNILCNPETGAYILDEIDLNLVTSTKDLLQFKKKKSTNRQAELFGRPAYQLKTSQLLAAAQPFPTRDPETYWLSDQERAERGKATFSDLPGTEQEVNGISQVLKNNRWQTKVHIGKEALEQAVKSVNNPAILHIATHGFFIQSEAEDFRQRGRNVTPIFTQENKLNAPSSTNPMLRSGLLLAGAATYLNAEKKPKAEDGILTAYEAANLDLDNTELVVLSACETGLGEVKNGEGVYGLQRAFKVSGAKTILMSLWKVDDTSTQELMTAFYSTWLKTGDKRQAFRQAQQQIRDKYKLPEYWGAFVMVGE